MGQNKSYFDGDRDSVDGRHGLVASGLLELGLLVGPFRQIARRLAAALRGDDGLSDSYKLASSQTTHFATSASYPDLAPPAALAQA